LDGLNGTGIGPHRQAEVDLNIDQQTLVRIGFIDGSNHPDEEEFGSK
jgi:hypothetical protein